MAIERTPVLVVFFKIPVPSDPRNCAPDNPESLVPSATKAFENATLADPSTLLPARFRAVVHFAALPVVF